MTTLKAAPQDVRQTLLTLVANGELSQRANGNFFRPARAASGPEDVLEFLARKGGIRDDEGHNLGITGLSAEERKGLSPSAQQVLKQQRRFGTRDWRRMTRAGPLLRRTGMSIDYAGEALHEVGYLTGADPDVTP